MAGFGFCDRLVKNEASKDYSITLIGDEPSPAYDRVNLSKLFQPGVNESSANENIANKASTRQSSANDTDESKERNLELADSQWYLSLIHI